MATTTILRDQVRPYLNPAELSVFAGGASRLTMAKLDAIRNDLAEYVWSLPSPQQLGSGDEQTLNSIIALSEAIQSTSMTSESIDDWAIVSSPRCSARSAFIAVIDKYRNEGAWDVSIEVIPHWNSRAVAGAVSLSLASRRPCMALAAESMAVRRIRFLLPRRSSGTQIGLECGSCSVVGRRKWRSSTLDGQSLIQLAWPRPSSRQESGLHARSEGSALMPCIRNATNRLNPMSIKRCPTVLSISSPARTAFTVCGLTRPAVRFVLKSNWRMAVGLNQRNSRRPCPRPALTLHTLIASYGPAPLLHRRNGCADDMQMFDIDPRSRRRLSAAQRGREDFGQPARGKRSIRPVTSFVVGDRPCQIADQRLVEECPPELDVEN